MTPAARLGLAALAGTLYGLAQVGFGLWPGVFPALAGLWIALRGASRLRATLLGFSFGAFAYAVAMAWLVPPIARFVGGSAGLGALLWGLHGAWIALGFGIIASLLCGLDRRGVPAWLAWPAALVPIEWLQPHVFAAPVGAALIHAPALPQIASLGGPLLLSAAVALTSGWLAEAARAAAAREGPKALRKAGIGAASIAAWIGLGTGLERAAEIEAVEGAPLRVGLVQANEAPLAPVADPRPIHRAHLEASRRLLREGELDLLVWPENAYRRALPRPLPFDGGFLRGDLDVPLVFGANAIDASSGRRRARNAAFLVDRAGRVAQAYDKTRLIPFAEIDPLAGFGVSLDAWLPEARRFEAGEELVPLVLDDSHRLAVPICYEVTFAALVRRMVVQGDATLLVTLANDAWLGRSRGPAMHLAIARLRAIEQRRWLVRATTTGISAIVDPTGRVVARTPLFEPAALRATVHARRDATLYARLGDWPAALASVALAVGLAWPRGLGARASRAHSPDRGPFT